VEVCARNHRIPIEWAEKGGRKDGSAQEFGKVADWRECRLRLDPGRYRVGLELSDSALGGLAIPHGGASDLSERHADYSWQKRREAEFIDSKGTFDRSREIGGDR